MFSRSLRLKPESAMTSVVASCPVALFFANTLHMLLASISTVISIWAAGPAGAGCLKEFSQCAGCARRGLVAAIAAGDLS